MQITIGGQLTPAALIWVRSGVYHKLEIVARLGDVSYIIYGAYIMAQPGAFVWRTARGFGIELTLYEAQIAAILNLAKD